MYSGYTSDVARSTTDNHQDVAARKREGLNDGQKEEWWLVKVKHEKIK